MSDDKIVKLRVVSDTSPTREEVEAQFQEAHEELVRQMMDDGPYEWVLGVARRMDGSLINFGSNMELRDFALAVAVLNNIATETIRNSLSLKDE